MYSPKSKDDCCINRGSKSPLQKEDVRQTLQESRYPVRAVERRASLTPLPLSPSSTTLPQPPLYSSTFSTLSLPPRERQRQRQKERENELTWEPSMEEDVH